MLYRYLSRTNTVTTCDECGGKCCTYFAWEIDAPRKAADWDHLRWLVSHRNTSVYLEDDVWYMFVQEPCEHLDANGRCRVYNRRPKTCRDYSVDECEANRPWKPALHFETSEEIEEYYRKTYPRRKPLPA